MQNFYGKIWKKKKILISEISTGPEEIILAEIIS
jgi:hypothetical protein